LTFWLTEKFMVLQHLDRLTTRPSPFLPSLINELTLLEVARGNINFNEMQLA